MRLGFWLIAGLLVSLQTFAQEVIQPVKHRRLGLGLFNQARTQSDTLNLPFIDDFSSTDLVPNQNWWIDRDVLVNNSFVKLGITTGIATFDGLDQEGNAYDLSTPSGRGEADKLTSKPLNLGGRTLADSIYLSFYFLPKGLGEQPDFNDSLVVQFKNSSGVWEYVWGKTGYTDSVFRLVMLPINKSQWLYKGFQFRFVAFGSLAGNMDHWHVDYVYLAAGRNRNDTLFQDISWATPASNPLKRYTTMPWGQFAHQPASWIDTAVWVTSRNLGTTANATFGFNARFTQPSGPIFQNQPVVAYNYPRDTIFRIRFNPLTSTLPLPPTNADSVRLNLRYYITINPDINKRNDTVVREVLFTNRFAYDDGVPEYSYGLNAQNGQIAYKFILSKPDSLRGIDMLFVQNSFPVTSELITLKVWSSIPEPGTGKGENLLYQKTFQRVRYMDSLNQFVTYAFDSAIAVTDSFYVGWQQGTNKLLNLGIDNSTDATDRMFVNVGGGWSKSVIRSAWCIRPIVGNANLFVVNNKEVELPQFSIFPNPTRQYLNFQSDDFSGNGRLKVWDASGKLVKEVLVENGQADLATISPGLYLIQLIDNADRAYRISRVVIQP